MRRITLLLLTTVFFLPLLACEGDFRQRAIGENHEIIVVMDESLHEGATAEAVIDGGVIDEIIITNGGRSYVQGSTTIVITGDGDDAAADAVVTNRVKRETIDAFGSITA